MLQGLVAYLTIPCLSYISFDKTLSLFYKNVDCSFPLKYRLVWLYPFLKDNKF